MFVCWKGGKGRSGQNQTVFNYSGANCIEIMGIDWVLGLWVLSNTR